MRQQTTPTQDARGFHACSADEELDLSWQWDTSGHGAGRAGLRAYVEKEMPHLLRAYDADFLVDAVESTRARLHGPK